MKLLLIGNETATLRRFFRMMKQQTKRHQIVGAVHDCGDALDFLSRQEVEAVICSTGVPYIGGVSPIVRLKERFPHLPILTVGARRELELLRSAMSEGAMDFLVRPFSQTALQNALNRVERLTRGVRSRKIHEQRQQLLRFLSAPQPIPLSIGVAAPYFVGMLDVCSHSIAFREIAMEHIASILPIDTVKVPYLSCLLYLTSSGLCDPNIAEALKMELDSVESITSAQLCFAYHPECTEEELIMVCNACRQMLRPLRYNFYGNMMRYTDYMRFCDDQNDMRMDPYFDLVQITRMITKQDSSSLRKTLEAGWTMLHRRYTFFIPECIIRCINRFLLDLEQRLQRYFDNFSLPIPGGREDSLSAYFDQASSIHQLGKQLVDYICSLTIPSRLGETMPQFILDAVHYIDTNYHLPITLNSVAQHAYMNNWYFSDQFGKYMSLPVKEYINKVRIHYASDMLRDPAVKIYEVSAATGFNDPTYFSTVFKRFCGMSPKDYQLKKDRRITVSQP